MIAAAHRLTPVRAPATIPIVHSRPIGSAYELVAGGGLDLGRQAQRPEPFGQGGRDRLLAR
jgi:hypothetical protein